MGNITIVTNRTWVERGKKAAKGLTIGTAKDPDPKVKKNILKTSQAPGLERQEVSETMASFISCTII